jgi:hypothetical protein
MKNAVQLDAIFEPALFHAPFYNAMLTVEEATDKLSEALLAVAKREMRALFLRHGVIGICGMNLLHRHWSVGSDEIPLQTRCQQADKPALITAPALQPRPDAIAASWFVSPEEGHLLPFEFSTDRLVVESSARLQAAPDFFADAAATLAAHGLDKLFGICIAMREALSADDAADWVEQTMAERSSVVTAEAPGRFPPQNLIQTVWVFSPEADDSACHTACFRASKCVNIIRFNPDGPPTSTHDEVSGSHQKQHEVGPA